MLQELRSVGVPCNGDPTAAAAALSLDLLKQLPYCTAVLQEAMRMFPAGVMAASRCAQGGARRGGRGRGGGAQVGREGGTYAGC